jgi:hypothetical protein
VTDPVGVVDEVRTLSVVVAVRPAPRVTEDGLKAADPLPGPPVASNETAPVNPPVDVTLTVYVAVWPRVTDWLAGVTPKLMPGLTVWAA